MKTDILRCKRQLKIYGCKKEKVRFKIFSNFHYKLKMYYLKLKTIFFSFLFWFYFKIMHNKYTGEIFHYCAI